MNENRTNNHIGPSLEIKLPRDFLLQKNKAGTQPQSDHTAINPEYIKLKESVPKMPCGEVFFNKAEIAFDRFFSFAAMVIRIDPFPTSIKNKETSDLLPFLLEIVKLLQKECDLEQGIWGHIDPDFFCCCYFEKNGRDVEKRAKKLKKTLKKNNSSKSVSIGISTYPAVNFPRNKIIENAIKAIDHAAFYGPDSIAVFDAVTLNISGDKYYQEGKIVEAIKEYKYGLMLDPSSVNLHNSLGVAYGVLSAFDIAEQEFETAMWLDPQDAMAIYNHGLIHKLQDDSHSANEYFNKAYENGKDVFEIVLQMGLLSLEKENTKETIRLFKDALELKPDSGLTYRYLGDAYVKEKMINDAVQAYMKAIKQNPNDAASLSALGYYLDIQGENKEITTMFCEQAVEIQPSNGLFRYRLGMLYYNGDNLENALNEFNMAIKLGHDASPFIKEIKNRLTARAS